MSDLAGLQLEFADALLSGAPGPTAAFIGEAEAVTRRLALYRGNLTAHWERALSMAYPVIRKMVGDEFFRALAREYGRATPPQQGDLGHFGDHLAEFLDTFGPVAPYPYMPDMARLEWAVHLAHSAADSRALDGATLCAMPLETLESTVFSLVPSARLVSSEWAINALWRAHQADGPEWPGTLAVRCHLVVARPAWRPQPVSLSLGEFAALDAMDAGDTFGGALQLAFDLDPHFDPATALPLWLQNGLIAHPDALPHDTQGTSP